MNKPLCCGQPVRTYKKDGAFVVSCDICKRTAESKTADGAYKAFNAFLSPQSKAVALLPKERRQVMQFLTTHKGGLMRLGPADVDTSVLSQIYGDNVRYVENSPHLDNVLKSQQGIESVQHALEEAFSMLVTLGKSGDIVPFGSEASLIESVEAQKFCLTTGASAPFEKDTVEIEVIHKDDIQPVTNVDPEIIYGSREIYKKDGDLHVNIVPGCPRGKIVQVVVYGKLKSTGKVIGHVYDKQTLLDKAKASPAYRQYLADKTYFDQLKSENKLKKMNGRFYFEKQIPKRDGSTWTKKIFEDELTNPYAENSGNQSEMLSKVAGKSFLRKYMKVRNSEAAAQVINSMSSEEQLEKGMKDTINGFDSVDEDFVDAEMTDDIQAEFEIEEGGEDGELNKGRESDTAPATGKPKSENTNDRPEKDETKEAEGSEKDKAVFNSRKKKPAEPVKESDTEGLGLF